MDPFKYPETLVKKLHRLAREVSERNTALASDLPSSSNAEVFAGEANKFFYLAWKRSEELDKSSEES